MYYIITLNPTLLSIKNISKRTGLSQDYIRNLVIAGKVQSFAMEKKILVEYESLVEYINQELNHTID